jgi:uncharacterized PurR-regulated membrane protein YhhQ (DUF165 family)
MMKSKAFWMLISLFVGLIFLSNWLVATFGIIPVGFSLFAPAGVITVGITFLVRDYIQKSFGKSIVLTLIVVGAILSYFINPPLAIASGLAFLFSEFFDFLVYTYLKEKTFFGAVVLSNFVGSVLDSIIFLQIAFGSLEFLVGQVVAKMYITGLFVVVYIYMNRRRDGSSNSSNIWWR